jgi:hypothetical protein
MAQIGYQFPSFVQGIHMGQCMASGKVKDR